MKRFINRRTHLTSEEVKEAVLYWLEEVKDHPKMPAMCVSSLWELNSEGAAIGWSEEIGQ